MKIKEICEYGKKSKIKAGEGLSEGNVKFFTSSSESNKFVKEEQFTNPGIIMGTGGNATLHYCDEPFSVSTDCLVLFPKIKVSPKHLYYFFKGNFHVLQSGFKGAGLKHTSKKYIDEISLNHIPSNDEQVQIVNILDNVNDIIVKKNQQLQEYDQLIKSRFVEMFGDIFNGKSNYPTVKISEVVIPKIERAKKDFNSDDEIKYVDISSVDNEKNIIIGYSDYLMKDAPSRAQQHVRKDDIVISTVRPNLNNVAKVSDDYSNIVASSGFCVLRASMVEPNFLFALVSMQSFADYLASLTTGANYPAVSDKDILNFEIPNAPFEEQTKFSDFIKQVDKLKFVVQQSLDETQKLFDSLMQKYFG